ESLANRFIAYRESLGFEVLPHTGGDRPPFEVLCERLRANRVVCLMADRDLTRSGVQVDFFGEPTRMPAGPARLALETGAVLLPAHLWFEPDGWGMQVYPPIDVDRKSTRLNSSHVKISYAVFCLKKDPPNMGSGRRSWRSGAAIVADPRMTETSALVPKRYPATLVRSSRIAHTQPSPCARRTNSI